MTKVFCVNFLFLGILIFPVFCCNLDAKKLTEVERKKIINDLSNNWKEYLGDMDFSNKFLFERILYLKPQPISTFEVFKDVKLDKTIISDHEIWLKKYFKDELLERLIQLKPSKYYLRKNKKESSLLFYQTEFDDMQITMLENFTVLLITLKPNCFNIEEGIKREYLKNILSKWFNIDEYIVPIRKLLKKPVYHNGLIFANKQKDSHVIFTSGWQDDIVCFLTEKGISFLLFKVSRERALIGIPTNPAWLDKGLSQEK